MPTYIALMNWTGDGIQQVKDSPKRLDAGRKAFKKLGVKLKDTYLTMGRYDLVCILEAPDDETFAKAILTLGAKGAIRTETLKAFNEAEYRKIIDAL
ncbi:MAG TPA: GYD domain-containing protein [Pyrinomonadaceae bacterium]|nr:GYD domain-containing protein [Pyrinomonadaceae bacterium]